MKKTILSMLLMSACCTANAGVVVIGNSQGPDAISLDTVKQLYLGKGQQLPNGATAQLVELKEGSAERAEFHAKTTGRTDAQLQSNWSRLVFTGKATAPVIANDSAAMINAIKANSNAIGYLDEAAVTADVKVLLKL
ncbi:MAG: phosphate ABC transporter substrate-binding protein [Shewanella sp.]